MKIYNASSTQTQSLKKPNSMEHLDINELDFKFEMNRQTSINQQKIYGYTVNENVLKEKPDYTTMTDVEIYNSIMNDYKNKYGDDFMEWYILNLSPRTNEEADQVRHLHEDLDKHIEGDYSKVREAARKASYGDMSIEKVRQEITKKYIKPGMTLRDFLYMSHEMFDFGVDVGMRQLGEFMISRDGANHLSWTNGEVNEHLMTILDKPLNVKDLIANVNGMRFANNPSYSDLTTKFISYYFNLPIGNDGYLVDESKDKYGDLPLTHLHWSIRDNNHLFEN